MSLRLWWRASSALVKTARREAESEPVSALMLMSALATVHLAPLFQIHQLGEAGRLARDSGFSALLVAGVAFSVFGVVRSVGRELANGTATVALALAVPRPVFLAAKTVGVLFAFLRFALATTAATLLSSFSCVMGSLLEGDDGVAHVSGDCFALGIGAVVGALLLAALLHRMRRAPFAITFFSLLVWLQLAASAIAFLIPTGSDVAPMYLSAAMKFKIFDLLPVMAVVWLYVAVFTVIGVALVVRLRPVAVGTVIAALLTVSLVVSVLGWRWTSFAIPVFSDFWLADTLIEGTPVSWQLVAFRVCTAFCYFGFWFAAGAMMFENRDIG